MKQEKEIRTELRILSDLMRKGAEEYKTHRKLGNHARAELTRENLKEWKANHRVLLWVLDGNFNSSEATQALINTRDDLELFGTVQPTTAKQVKKAVQNLGR